MKKQLAGFTDKESIGNFFGCLMKDTSLFGDWVVSEGDLELSSFSKLYKCIGIMADSNYEKVAVEDLVIFASKLYEGDTFIQKKAQEWLEFHLLVSDLSQIEIYYNNIMKCSLVRSYERAGVKTEKLINFSQFDLDGGLEEQKERFARMSIERVIEFFKDLNLEVENKFKNVVKTTTIEVGKNLRQLKEKLKETPELGRAFQGDIYTTVSRGARLTKYFIRSASSGGGRD